MAQRRMIDKNISVSEQVANLPVQAQLIFTWSIPHADDIGMLPGKHRTLKALIVPMWDIPLEKFSEYVASIVEEGLWKVVTYEGEEYHVVPNFGRHQTLKKDRNPQTMVKLEAFKTAKDGWTLAEAVLSSFGILLEDDAFQNGTLVEPSGFQNGTQEVPEEKRSEDKRRKGSKIPSKPQAARVDKVKAALKDARNTTLTDPVILADVMKGFEEVNPSIARLYGNTTQRKALDRMIVQFGEEQVRKMVSILPQVNSKQYAPTSTTPVELENNLGKIRAFLQKEKDGASKRGKEIIE